MSIKLNNNQTNHKPIKLNNKANTNKPKVKINNKSISISNENKNSIKIKPKINTLNEQSKDKEIINYVNKLYSNINIKLCYVFVYDDFQEFYIPTNKADILTNDNILKKYIIPSNVIKNYFHKLNLNGYSGTIILQELPHDAYAALFKNTVFKQQQLTDKDVQ